MEHPSLPPEPTADNSVFQKRVRDLRKKKKAGTILPEEQLIIDNWEKELKAMRQAMALRARGKKKRQPTAHMNLNPEGKTFLRVLVQEKIKELGAQEGAKFFGVCERRAREWYRGTQNIPLAAVEKAFRAHMDSQYITRERLNWEGKQVMILFPSYQAPTMPTMISLFKLMGDRTKISFQYAVGDSIVAMARNKLAHIFMESNIPYGFFLDNDMVPPHGDARTYNEFTKFHFTDRFAGENILNRLYSHNKTLIGGLYFGRHQFGLPMYAEGANNIDERNRCRRMVPFDAIAPTQWVGTGCMLVHRQVFLDIQKKYPELKGKNGMWNYFSNNDTSLYNGIVDIQRAIEQNKSKEELLALISSVRSTPWFPAMGEDILFCQRARISGHQPYVDFGSVCGHIGNMVYGPKNTIDKPSEANDRL